MLKRHIALTIGGAMLASAAIAQTTAPSPTAPAAPSAPSAAPATQTKAGDPGEMKLGGQGKWRASKLMGVDIYGADGKKVGDVTEVVVDKTGKIDMVTVGVGGFLGIGSKDVAVPFDQVQWSDQPMTPPAAPAGNAPATGMGAGSTAGTGAATTAAAPREPTMYPDHGKINMTKEQLTAAPAVSYTGM